MPGRTQFNHSIVDSQTWGRDQTPQHDSNTRALGKSAAAVSVRASLPPPSGPNRPIGGYMSGQSACHFEWPLSPMAGPLVARPQGAIGGAARALPKHWARGRRAGSREDAHAGSRARVTSLRGLYDAATLRALIAPRARRANSQALAMGPMRHGGPHAARRGELGRPAGAAGPGGLGVGAFPIQSLLQSRILLACRRGCDVAPHARARQRRPRRQVARPHR